MKVETRNTLILLLGLSPLWYYFGNAILSYYSNSVHCSNTSWTVSWNSNWTKNVLNCVRLENSCSISYKQTTFVNSDRLSNDIDLVIMSYSVYPLSSVSSYYYSTLKYVVSNLCQLVFTQVTNPCVSAKML